MAAAPAKSGIAGVPANSPLLNPATVLTGPALVQAAQGLAHAQTSPVLSALAQQIAQNNQQTSGAIKQVGGFYNQLGALAGNDATQVGQTASGLNSQLQGIGNDEQSQLQGIAQNALASLAKYAPQSDSSNSLLAPAAQALVAESARQQGLAAQNQGAFRSFGATQGANAQNLANSNLGTFALGGQEALHNIAQAGQVRNEPLMAKVANTKALYGADLATALGRLRQQEITNQISRQGLGIKQQSANAATANAATNRTNAGTRQKALSITQQNDRANQQLRRAGIRQSNTNNLRDNTTRLLTHNARTGAGATKPLPPGQNLTALTQLGEAATAIKAWEKSGFKSPITQTINGKVYRQGDVLNAHPTDAQIRQQLGARYNPVLIDAAFELEDFGTLTPKTALALHRAGVRGGTYNGSPIKVANGPGFGKGQVKNTTSGVNNAANNAVKNVLSGF